jgi:hypothetical protein
VSQLSRLIGAYVIFIIFSFIFSFADKDMYLQVLLLRVFGNGHLEEGN